ncbi:hypothetical protein EV2_012038 [Malus domestica]
MSRPQEEKPCCPLCAEEMDLTDKQLHPCECGYEICLWCWHQIIDMAEKDEREGRCPACRAPYDKENIVGSTGPRYERLAAELKKMKIELNKMKIDTEARRRKQQLSGVRVVQRNLVHIVGLPLDLADEHLLRRRKYFGQYGKVVKVFIRRFTDNTSSNVYITYSKEVEAIRCIQRVDGRTFLWSDGRALRACFGNEKVLSRMPRKCALQQSSLYVSARGGQVSDSQDRNSLGFNSSLKMKLSICHDS